MKPTCYETEIYDAANCCKGKATIIRAMTAMLVENGNGTTWEEGWVGEVALRIEGQPSLEGAQHKLAEALRGLADKVEQKS
jgi:hypothetical protein